MAERPHVIVRRLVGQRQLKLRMPQAATVVCDGSSDIKAGIRSKRALYSADPKMVALLSPTSASPPLPDRSENAKMCGHFHWATYNRRPA